MYDRACQAVAKQALEPEWEAKMEANSYGFRPGRSAQDAIEAIFDTITFKSKYVLDADIKGCFDHIDHHALLEKLRTYPAMRRLVKGWLKAGVMEGLDLSPTTTGTPQGGVVSPLLANIALSGMEEALVKAYIGEKKAPSSQRGAPKLIRYADDVRHLTHNEILLAEKGGTEEYGLRVISPTWNRKAKGKGACEKRGKRVKALRRCPARPA
jgi:RNA-directed DNA polymerase